MVRALMAARVLLQPSGRQFEALGADTLLEAGLRAGLAMNYGCSGGSCGLCKARLVSGEVRWVRHHDHVFSEAEKSQGYVLLCCCSAEGDVVLEAGIAHRPEEIQFQEIAARVKAVSPLTDKVMLLHLQTPRSTRLRFLAGQSVALSVGQPGEGDASGVYPIASCPCDDRNLQFHVRRIAGDRFAERVFDGLRTGQSVAVYGPVGDFVLQPGSRNPLLLLACNSGFAPIKSLIEHAMSLEEAESLHLYWLATVEGGHYLSNWCRAWADALDNFHYHELAAEALDGPGPARMLAEIRRAHPDLGRCDVCVAGPQAFVAQARAALTSGGAMPARLVTTVA
jgi:CDP-4-dehydro-6-deoxyglucose reductase